MPVLLLAALKKNKMPSLKGINEESKKFSRKWKSQTGKGAIALLMTSILFTGLCPATDLQYIVSAIFFIPILLWAYELAEIKINRRMLSILVLY